MGISADQLRTLIYKVLSKAGLYSPQAEALLMGTAAQESGLGKYLRQLGGGPALGIFQMEPFTEKDIWNNFLKHRYQYQEDIWSITGHRSWGPWLEWDLAYQILMARFHYLRVPEPLPSASDIESQAVYWKRYWNTIHGKGKESDFIRAHKDLIGNKYEF